MSEKFSLIDKTLGYVTAEDQTNTKPEYLVVGSQNVLIDRQRKVRIRPGYSRLGAANTALTPVRQAFTWNTSKGSNLPIRCYDDEWEVYLGTLDTTVINAWTRFTSSKSTTATPRFTTWFDAAEIIDLLLGVQGDTGITEWNGAVAVVGSIPDGTHITKAGTTTWAQNRFYTTRNKSLTCVRTGTTYTYSAGESSTNLTVTDSSSLLAGDILIQTVIVTADKPSATHTNDTIFTFENQIVIGSEDDEYAYLSQNDDYDDFTYSAPRVSGEGALFTLTDPVRGFGSLSNKLVIFAGDDDIFNAQPEQITVGATLAETIKVVKLKTGSKQGAYSQETIVSTGNSLLYLSNEPAIREIESPDQVLSINPKTLSNPIKPDFDGEDFSNAFAHWWKSSYYLTAPTDSHVYILEYVEDADGKLRRFWQPPQILPVRCFSTISGWIHGHSNGVPETYKLFDTDTFSDLTYNDVSLEDEKIPINAIMIRAYRDFGDSANLKDFDEYYVEGEITPSTTDLLATINYDFAGDTQQIEKTIDGTDEDILQGNVGDVSLAQQSLSQQSLGGLLNPPSDARRFSVIFEIAREEFGEMQEIFSTNELDRYWAITSSGTNARISRRKNISIKK